MIATDLYYCSPFQHLQNPEQYRALCSADCFHVLDHASATFQLEIKEPIHIQREHPPLNQRLHHVNLKLSLQFSHFRALLHSVVPIHYISIFYRLQI